MRFFSPNKRYVVKKSCEHAPIKLMDVESRHVESTFPGTFPTATPKSSGVNSCRHLNFQTLPMYGPTFVLALLKQKISKKNEIVHPLSTKLAVAGLHSKKYSPHQQCMFIVKSFCSLLFHYCLCVIEIQWFFDKSFWLATLKKTTCQVNISKMYFDWWRTTWYKTLQCIGFQIVVEEFHSLSHFI